MAAIRHMRLALLGSAFLAGTAHAQTTGWTISEASPGVAVLHEGKSKVAARGGALEVGDIVATGTNARAVLVNGNEYAVVAPNSRLQIADPESSSGLLQFFEKVGNVVFGARPTLPNLVTAVEDKYPLIPQTRLRATATPWTA